MLIAAWHFIETECFLLCKTHDAFLLPQLWKEPIHTPVWWLQNLQAKEAHPPLRCPVEHNPDFDWLWSLLWSLALELPGTQLGPRIFGRHPTRRPSAFCDLLCCEDVPDPGQPQKLHGWAADLKSLIRRGQELATLPPLLSSTSIFGKRNQRSLSRTLSMDGHPSPQSHLWSLIIHLPYSASHSWAGKEPFQGGSAISQ